MDQCYICMCRRAIAWTSNVIYVRICAIGLRGLRETERWKLDVLEMGCLRSSYMWIDFVEQSERGVCQCSRVD